MKKGDWVSVGYPRRVSSNGFGYVGNGLFSVTYEGHRGTIYMEREDLPEPMTVAEAFKYAGFPLHANVVGLHYDFCCRDWRMTFKESTEEAANTLGRATFDESIPGWRAYRDDDEDCTELIFNLARLPVADAWDALPDAVKKALEETK